MSPDQPSSKRPSLPPAHLPPPIIHLKKKTLPQEQDQWHTYWTNHLGGSEPLFIPPIYSSPVASARTQLVEMLHDPDSLYEHYGGAILTSQRAVEQLGDAVRQVYAQGDSLASMSAEQFFSSNTQFHVFTVGPATGAATRKVIDEYNLPWTVCGEESGNGAALAEFIVSHYDTIAVPAPDSLLSQEPQAAEKASTVLSSPQNTPKRKPLLYLVGETHDPGLAATLRTAAPPIPTTEVIVYATHQAADFAAQLHKAIRSYASLAPGMQDSTILKASESSLLWNSSAPANPTTIHVPSSPIACPAASLNRAPPALWILAWAPSGLAALLQALDWLADSSSPATREAAHSSSAAPASTQRYDPTKRTDLQSHLNITLRFAAIGPKTAQVARDKYAFEFECVARKPTVESVWEEICSYWACGGRESRTGREDTAT